MQDENGALKPRGGDQDDPETPQADIEFVDRLPGGRLVMPVEQKNRFTWLVVKGQMTPQARDQMASWLQRIVGNRLWEQNWQPPQDGHPN